MGDDARVGGEVHVLVHRASRPLLVVLCGDGLGADPPVAVPLGLAVAQPHAVHHARAQEPVVVGVVQAERVRPVAQVTAVQPGGHLTGDRQVERRDLLLYGGEGPFQETAVSRRGHDPSRFGGSCCAVAMLRA